MSVASSFNLLNSVNMTGRILKYALSVTLLFMAALGVSAAKPTVNAKLDSVNLLMGRVTMLHLEVVQDKNAKGDFPLFSEFSQRGIVGVCGDSVELRSNILRDTVELGSGRVQVNYSVPVQAYDSGYYHLPEFLYVSGADTVRSNRLALKVIPVEVGENDPIADYHGVEEPEGKSIFDNVPDWVINYWWILIVLIVLAAALWWGYSRYRKQGYILPKKPEPTPYEKAMSDLQKLKARKLWENGHEKEYFTELTEILRVYLDRRFGINAMEMTSSEIMQQLTDNHEVKDKRSYVRQILSIADFVKFAKVRPLPDDNIAAFNNAVKFVEETKPAPVVDDKNEEGQNGVSAEKGGKK